MSYSLSSCAGNVHRGSLLQEEMSSCTPAKLQKRKTAIALHQVKMGSLWILSGSLWTKGNGINWPHCVQYAKGSFLCAGTPKSFAVTSSFFQVWTTKKHLKRQTKDLFTSKLLKLSALKLCHKVELTSPSYPHKFWYKYRKAVENTWPPYRTFAKVHH